MAGESNEYMSDREINDDGPTDAELNEKFLREIADDAGGTHWYKRPHDLDLRACSMMRQRGDVMIFEFEDVDDEKLLPTMHCITVLPQFIFKEKMRIS